MYAPSSSYLPPFMRVNPILAWSYGAVWRFLKRFNLPYCALYDDGYTSLGHVHNTARNPALRCATLPPCPPPDVGRVWRGA